MLKVRGSQQLGQLGECIPFSHVDDALLVCRHHTRLCVILVRFGSCFGLLVVTFRVCWEHRCCDRCCLDSRTSQGCDRRRVITRTGLCCRKCCTSTPFGPCPLIVVMGVWWQIGVSPRTNHLLHFENVLMQQHDRNRLLELTLI